MAETIWLKGKPLASKILESIRSEYNSYNLNIIPRLDIILANNRSDSQLYIKKKIQAIEQIGFHCQLHQVAPQIDKLKDLISELNNDNKVHGIIVQSPIGTLDSQSSQNNNNNNQLNVYELISPEKDIDGLHPLNQGKLFSISSPLPLLIPCTAKGIMKLLEHYNIAIHGKVAVIIGRSQIVGLPISHLLNRANATTIQCHSHTKNIVDYIKMADILVCAIGKANYIKLDWLSCKTTIIDVGINYVNGKIVGDVEREGERENDIDNDNNHSHRGNVYSRSPVPGGVGPMTVAMLIDNLWLAFKNQVSVHLPLDHPIRLELITKNSNSK